MICQSYIACNYSELQQHLSSFDNAVEIEPLLVLVATNSANGATRNNSSFNVNRLSRGSVDAPEKHND